MMASDLGLDALASLQDLDDVRHLDALVQQTAANESFPADEVVLRDHLGEVHALQVHLDHPVDDFHLGVVRHQDEEHYRIGFRHLGVEQDEDR